MQPSTFIASITLALALASCGRLSQVDSSHFSGNHYAGVSFSKSNGNDPATIFSNNDGVSFPDSLPNSASLPEYDADAYDFVLGGSLFRLFNLVLVHHELNYGEQSSSPIRGLIANPEDPDPDPDTHSAIFTASERYSYAIHAGIVPIDRLYIFARASFNALSGSSQLLNPDQDVEASADAYTSGIGYGFGAELAIINGLFVRVEAENISYTENGNILTDAFEIVGLVDGNPLAISTTDYRISFGLRF